MVEQFYKNLPSFAMRGSARALSIREVLMLLDPFIGCYTFTVEAVSFCNILPAFVLLRPALYRRHSTGQRQRRRQSQRSGLFRQSCPRASPAKLSSFFHFSHVLRDHPLDEPGRICP